MRLEKLTFLPQSLFLVRLNFYNIHCFWLVTLFLTELFAERVKLQLTPNPFFAFFIQTASSRFHVTFSIFSPPRRILAMIYEGSIKREFSLAWLWWTLKIDSRSNTQKLNAKRANFRDGVRAFRSQYKRHSSWSWAQICNSKRVYRSIIYAQSTFAKSFWKSPHKSVTAGNYVWSAR